MKKVAARLRRAYTWSPKSVRESDFNEWVWSYLIWSGDPSFAALGAAGWLSPGPTSSVALPAAALAGGSLVAVGGSALHLVAGASTTVVVEVNHGPGGAPWPGRLPPPSPTRVLGVPQRAEMVDATGRAVVVSGRGLLEADVDRLSVEGGPWQPVVAWAGPWPVTERWWSVRRRRARLQVVMADGTARLLYNERTQWWVEALYD